MPLGSARALLALLRKELLMMETVEGYHRLRKACADNLVHAVREVQRHLFHQLTDGFWHLLQDVCDPINPFDVNGIMYDLRLDHDP